MLIFSACSAPQQRNKSVAITWPLGSSLGRNQKTSCFAVALNLTHPSRVLQNQNILQLKWQQPSGVAHQKAALLPHHIASLLHTGPFVMNHWRCDFWKSIAPYVLFSVDLHLNVFTASMQRYCSPPHTVSSDVVSAASNSSSPSLSQIYSTQSTNMTSGYFRLLLFSDAVRSLCEEVMVRCLKLFIFSALLSETQTHQRSYNNEAIVNFTLCVYLFVCLWQCLMINWVHLNQNLTNQSSAVHPQLTLFCNRSNSRWLMQPADFRKHKNGYNWASFMDTDQHVCNNSRFSSPCCSQSTTLCVILFAKSFLANSQRQPRFLYLFAYFSWTAGWILVNATTR